MNINPWTELIGLTVGAAVIAVQAYRKGRTEERERCESICDQVWRAGRFSDSVRLVAGAIRSGDEEIDASRVGPHDHKNRALAAEAADVLRKFRPKAPWFSRAVWESLAVDWLLRSDALEAEREAETRWRSGA